MRYFCWNLVSTPSAKSEGYPILNFVAGSNNVRGRKNRKNARNHAPRNAPTPLQTKRRRRWSTVVSSGPTDAKPPAAAALEVPTAGVPTYLVAVPLRVSGGTEGIAGLGAAGAAGRAVAVAAGAAGAAGGAAGSPNNAVISGSVNAGRLFRFRRACSAAMADLLHFFPVASHF